MEPEIIKKIAEQIVQYLPTYSWTFLAVQVLLISAAAAIGAFFGEYFKTRGQHLATKADFDSLQAQLRANTELVETVKAEVNQRDLAKREWRNLRCLKIEQLLAKIHDCNDHLEQLGHDAVDRKVLLERDLLGEFQTIANLYFPELKTAVDAYSLAYRKHRQDLLNIRVEFLNIPPDTLIPQRLADKYHSIGGASWPVIMKAQDELTSAAAALLRKIMDVA